MDVLVMWRDNTQNIVAARDLAVLGKNKTLKPGGYVKMWYGKKWYFGSVIAVENSEDYDMSKLPFSDYSSDEESHLPLSKLREKINSDMLMDASKNESCINNTTGNPQTNFIGNACKKNNTCMSNNGNSENKVDGRCTDPLKIKIFQDIVLQKAREDQQEDSINNFDDDSNLDPDYILECEMFKCYKKSYKKCGCGFWMCKSHLSINDVCTYHESLEIEGELVVKSRRIRCRESEQYKKQHCEYVNCNSEVFSACDKCEALLCWTHFDVEVLECSFHQNLYRFMGYSVMDENIKTNLTANIYEIEGSSKENKRENKMTKNSMKIQAKKRKVYGEGYIIPCTMNLIPPKTLKPVCKSSYCKKFGKKCHIFTENQRNDILTDFYHIGDLQNQREYICRHVKMSDTRTKKTDSRKKIRFEYFLPFLGENVCVCKVFFLNTLSISEKFMRTSAKKLQSTGVVEKEKRGGRTKDQAERDARIRKNIEDHIELFPRVESHYCRKYSTREYLHPDLSIPKMYSMYLEKYKGQDIGGVDLYRKIFKSMGLSFHRPKKDQCTQCLTFKEANEEVKGKLKERYEKHIFEKEQARKHKKESKERALSKNNLVSAVFDLQQVIHLPISNESALFYKQRFALYNFTIYNLAMRDCHCYTWTEVISKRGASEIATCLFMFLKECDIKGVTSVELFSDGCQGQNKNSILPAMFLYFLRSSTNVQTITHYFFESFHGQNEGDSAHSTISTALSRAGNIYVPSQVIPILRLARRKHPYIVNELEFSDFLDFKTLSQNLRLLSTTKSFETKFKDNSVTWNKVMNIRVVKHELNKIFFKTSYSQEEFNFFLLPRNVNIENIEVNQLNKRLQKIPEKKYLSLISLTEGLNPVIRLKVYKDFYKNLPH